MLLHIIQKRNKRKEWETIGLFKNRERANEFYNFMITQHGQKKDYKLDFIYTDF